MYSLPIAYFLWALSFVGLNGIHRFYLKKYGSGALYLFTVGFFFVGTVFDFFRMPKLVHEANLRERYRDALDYNYMRRVEPLREVVPRAVRETPEKVILRLAKKNNGVASPAEVALEGDLGVDEARRLLDRLASKGHAELRVRRSGAVVYVFPEFMTDKSDNDFEDL